MKHGKLNPTSALFARVATIKSGESVLLLNSDDLELARWLVESVKPGGSVVALPASHRAVNLLASVPDLGLSEAVYPDPSEHGPVDVALLDLPRERERVRAYLVTAARTVRAGGRLYLAGANAGGAKSAIKDAAVLFGDAPVMDYKSGHRLALGTRPDELVIPLAWADSSPWQSQRRTITRPDEDYTVITVPGVFSWEHLDDGTALLLDHLGVEPDMDVLDIGCGYGIIGLAAARAGAQVTLVDDDLLAVRCARESVLANGLVDRCTVLASDVTGAIRDQWFDLVLSNPPFHQGVDVNTGVARRLVREACDVLRSGGRLRIVANRFLPYDRPMRETFGNVCTVAETGRFRVLESIRDG